MADSTTKILSVELDATQAIQGIVRLNEAIAQNNEQMKLNKRAIAEQTEVMKKGGDKGLEAAEKVKKLKQANVELEAQTKELTAEKRVLQKETQNEIRIQSQEEGSLRGLRAELSNLTKQYDNLSRAERDNEAIGGKLKNQINQVTTEIKKAEEGTQRYYRNVGNYQNAILGALGMNNLLAQSFMAVAASGDGVKGAFAAIGMQAKALGRSLMTLMTNHVFLALAGIAGAGMAFKWFYDYNMGIEQAMRLTREFTGLAGQDLSNLRAEIQATAKTYGKDYKEVLEAVDLLRSNYHKTEKEAIDIINKGFQSGADLNGDMLQKLKQYGPALHDAGIEANQLFALFQQTRSGIFTQQGLDAIRMASARIREMSTSTQSALKAIGINVNEMMAKLRSGEMSTFDAIQQVANKLKEIPNNAQEYGEIMTAVFGRQGKFAAQEMIEALGGIETNLDNLTKTTGDYGELTDELREKEVELQKAMEDAFGAGNAGVEEMTLNTQIFIKEGLINLVKSLKDVVSWTKRTWNENTILRNVMASIITVVRALGKVAWTPFAMVINVVKALIDALSKLSSALQAIRNNIATAFSGLGDIFEGIKNFDFGQIKEGIKKTASGTWQAVKSFGVGVGKAFYEGLTSWGGATRDWFAGFGDVGSWFDDITNSAFETSSYLDKIAGNIKSTTQNVKKQLDSISNDGGGGGGDKEPTSPKGTKGANTGKKSTAKSTADKEEERAEQERQRRMEALIKKGAEAEKRAYEEAAKLTKAGIVEMYAKRAEEISRQFDGIVTKTDEEAQALTKAKNALLKANLDEQQKALEDYEKKAADQRKKELEQAKADARKLIETQMAATDDGTQARLDYQLQLLQMEKDAELAIYENNEAMKAAIIAKYAKEEENARKQTAEAQVAIEQTKYSAIAGVVGGLSEVMGAFGEENKEMLVLQKTLALAEIMISQAVAIANAVKAGSNAINPWQMIAQIAASITAVTVAIAQAFKALDSAKFATGGYIKGAGTSTSDSIPVRVSNGESVMNANTTAMFGGLLSSLNQLGGGVPIQVQQTASSVRGEDMLARAVARGVAMLPAPVVSVEDINRGQRQVQVMNDRATL